MAEDDESNSLFIEIDHEGSDEGEFVIGGDVYTSGIMGSKGSKESYIIRDEDIYSVEEVEAVEVPESNQHSVIISRKNIPQAKKKEDGSGNPKGAKKLNCTVQGCNYSTVYSKDMARHMRKHTGEKPFVCNICSKSFSRYDKLFSHTKIHEGVMSFKCDECDYAAVEANALKRHMRKHSDNRPYRCQLCPYRSKDACQLTIHIRSHTGDTPYLCEFEDCSASFKTSSDLKRHQRVHSNDRPLKCPECPYSCRFNSNLSTHIKKHHMKFHNQSQSTVHDEIIRKSEFHVEGRKTHHLTNPSPHAVLSDPLTETDIIMMEPLLENVPEQTKYANLEKDPLSLTSTKTTTFMHPKKKFKSLAIAEQERMNMKKVEPELPFQFSCKQCTFQGNSIAIFEQHMIEDHDERIQLKKTLMALCRASNKRKSRKDVKAEERKVFPRYYICDFCPASFVREDSLRCHLRQHGSHETTSIGPNPSVVTPHHNRSIPMFAIRTNPQFNPHSQTDSLEYDKPSEPNVPTSNGVFVIVENNLQSHGRNDPSTSQLLSL